MDDDVRRATAGRWPWLRVAVAGESMRPTLEHGDWLLCRRTPSARGVRAGDVVVVARPDRPALLIVKRLVRRDGDGWWVEGDNAAASDDSRLFGTVPDGCVVAKVTARYWPRPRRV